MDEESSENPYNSWTYSNLRLVIRRYGFLQRTPDGEHRDP